MPSRLPTVRRSELLSRVLYMEGTVDFTLRAGSVRTSGSIHNTRRQHASRSHATSKSYAHMVEIHLSPTIILHALFAHTFAPRHIYFFLHRSLPLDRSCTSHPCFRSSNDVHVSAGRFLSILADIRTSYCDSVAHTSPSGSHFATRRHSRALPPLSRIHCRAATSSPYDSSPHFT